MIERAQKRKLERMKNGWQSGQQISVICFINVLSGKTVISYF